MNRKTRSGASQQRTEIAGKGKLKIKDLERRDSHKNLPAEESEAVKGGRTPVDHTIP